MKKYRLDEWKNVKHLAEGESSFGSLDLDICMNGLHIDVDWFRMVASHQVLNEKWHSHHGIEIHFMLDGENRFYTGDSAFDLHAGEMIILPSAAAHRLENRSQEAFVRCGLCFTVIDNGSNLSRYLLECLSLPKGTVMPIPPKVRRQLKACCREAEKGVTGYVLMIETLLLQLIVEVARALSGYPQNAEYESRKVSYGRMNIGRLKDMIFDSVSQGVTVGGLAKRLHMSSKHLQRLVQSEYHCTVKELIDACRFEKAKEYLKNMSLSVGEVASLVGFASEQSFSRFFKQTEGQTPRQFRDGYLCRAVPKK